MERGWDFQKIGKDLLHPPCQILQDHHSFSGETVCERGKSKSFPFGSASPMQTACLISFVITEMFDSKTHPLHILQGLCTLAAKPLATSMTLYEYYNSMNTLLFLKPQLAVILSKVKSPGQ